MLCLQGTAQSPQVRSMGFQCQGWAENPNAAHLKINIFCQIILSNNLLVIQIKCCFPAADREEFLSGVTWCRCLWKHLWGLVVFYWQSSFVEIPLFSWQSCVSKDVLRVLRMGNAALGSKQRKKKNNQREQLKSLRLYQNQTFPRRKKSQPWIQREGSGFQQFTGGMKKNQNIWLKAVNNNNNNKLTLWGLAFSGIYHQIGKFGEVRSGPRGSRGGFCLSIWIWQLNQHSNGSSSSVLVLIKNFTLDS